MPLTQANKEELKTLGIDPEALIAAITGAEEKAVTIPKGTVLSDQQLTERDNQNIKTGKKEGEKEATKIALAELTKNGLEVKGERWSDIATDIKGQISKDTDTKVKTYQDQNTALIADVAKFKTAAEEAAAALVNGKKELDIMAKFPANKAGLPADEQMMIIKNRGYKFDDEGVKSRTGELLKDTATHAALPLDKAIEHIWSTEGFKVDAAETEAGRGGGDGAHKGAVPKSMSEAQAAWGKINPNGNLMSDEFTSYANGLAKADTTFDMYK